MKYFIDLRNKEDIDECKKIGHKWSGEFFVNEYKFRNCTRCKLLQRHLNNEIWRTVDLFVESI